MARLSPLWRPKLASPGAYAAYLCPAVHCAPATRLRSGMPVLSDHTGARARVYFCYFDTGRAYFVADATTGTVIDRMIRRGLHGLPNRPAWGASYFGPGKRSVTSATGQAETQILHLMQFSSVDSGYSGLICSHRSIPGHIFLTCRMPELASA